MGRTPSPDGRRYQLETLWEVHHEILRRLSLGQKSVDIARDLNVTTPVVSYVKNSEIGRRQLDLMRGAADLEVVNVQGRIKELAATAVRVLEAGLEEDQPMLTRLKTAFDVLDRAGHAAPKVLRTENLHAHLTGEDLALLKERAKAEAEAGGIVIEAEEL